MDLNQTLFELTNKFPELISILKSIGFEKITDPRMMQTAGKIMTIPNGCRMRGISIEVVKDICEKNGFTIIE